jgi:hypothetical protein
MRAGPQVKVECWQTGKRNQLWAKYAWVDGMLAGWGRVHYRNVDLPIWCQAEDVTEWLRRVGR